MLSVLADRRKWPDRLTVLLNDDRNLRERHGASVNTVIALILRAVSFEVALYRSLFRWVTRRTDVPAGTVGFAYITIPWDSIATIGVRERSRDRSRALQVDREEQGNVLNVVIASRTNVYADDARGIVSLVREQLARNEGKVDRESPHSTRHAR